MLAVTGGRVDVGEGCATELLRIGDSGSCYSVQALLQALLQACYRHCYRHA